MAVVETVICGTYNNVTCIEKGVTCINIKNWLISYVSHIYVIELYSLHYQGWPA